MQLGGNDVEEADETFSWRNLLSNSCDVGEESQPQR